MLYEVITVEGGGVDAVAKSGGLRTVIEHVSEMAPAFRAAYFLADHAMTEIPVNRDVLIVRRGREAGPAAA